MQAIYEKRLKGHIDSRHFSWCQAIDVTYTEGGETNLVAHFQDQAELHGFLAQIRDLSVTLIFLNQRVVGSQQDRFLTIATEANP